jgi:hypothetical protein
MLHVYNSWPNYKSHFKEPMPDVEMYSSSLLCGSRCRLSLLSKTAKREPLAQGTEACRSQAHLTAATDSYEAGFHVK